MDLNKIFVGIVFAFALIGSLGITSAQWLPSSNTYSVAANNAMLISLASDRVCSLNLDSYMLNTELNLNSSVSSIVSPSISALNVDNTTLQQYVSGSNTDLKSFHSFVVSQLRPDLLTAITSFVQARKELVSSNHKINSQLKAARLTAISDYRSCELPVLLSVGNVKVLEYNSVLNAYQNYVNNLSTNIDKFTNSSLDAPDIAKLNLLLSNANSQVVVPLSSGLQNPDYNSNITILRNLINNYNLFNEKVQSGEQNSLSVPPTSLPGGSSPFAFHLGEQFILVFLTVRGDQLSPLAQQYGVSMIQYQTDLSIAASTLSSDGSTGYTNSQYQILRTQFKAVEGDLNLIRQQIENMRSLNNTSNSLSKEINLYNGDIALYQSKIANWSVTNYSLTNTSLNVTGLEAILSNANNTIILPLQSALASNNNTLMRNAIRSYCLYDGCNVNGAVDFHLAAQFAIQYLTARGVQVSSLALSDNVSMTTFQTDLSTASNTLASIIPNYDSKAEQSILWGQIGTAEHDLAIVIGKLQHHT